MDRDTPFSPVPLSKNAQPIRLRRDRRAIDVEEHLTEGKTNERIGDDRIQFRGFLLLIIVIFTVIVGRVAYLQISRGTSYRAMAERNRIRLEVVRAPRGVIFDRNRSLLLTNVPNFTLYATPADLPKTKEERNAISQTLSSVLPTLDEATTEQLLLNAVPGSLQPIVLSEHVEQQDAIRLSTVIARMPGVSLEAVSSRSYVGGEASAHVVGYLGKPTPEELKSHPELTPLSLVGRMGAELQYDTLLRGTDGVREVERDHLNKELSVVASQEPIPGKNLVLSINQGLQETLSNALKDTIDRLHVPGGAAVALDPRNGEVLAIVSQPSFDPNLFTKGGSEDEFAKIFNDERHPLFFRALSGSYPSGSTVKPVIASAALAEKVITEQTTVVSTGGIRVGPNFFPDWKAGGHGVTDVKKAIADSVNTFFYMVGGGFEKFDGLGVDRIVKYMKLFGLAQKLGIDLPNENAGFLPDSDWRNRPGAQKWYLGDTYNLSIGQGYINVTPLQVASYTAAIANGGTLYTPHIVHEILRPDGTVEEPIRPTIVRTTIADRFLAIVRAGMRQAVTSGSAKRLGDLPVAVAAKTGTAQFGNGDQTHAWITTFAPYERPEIVITILIEQGGEGSTNAQPIAHAGLQWYFAHHSP